MALFKCPECGNMISDQASACPNCGNPVLKKVLCRDCGNYLPEGAVSCPVCGCPVQQPFQNTSQPAFHQAPPNIGRYHNAPSSMNTQQRVQRFLMANGKFFPDYQIEEIRSNLLALNNQQMSSVECMSFKDPTTMLLISIFLGGLGVDRFMLDDTKNGVFKLLLSLFFFLIVTAIAIFVWWIVDLINIRTMTQEYNYEELTKAMSYGA